MRNPDRDPTELGHNLHKQRTLQLDRHSKATQATLEITNQALQIKLWAEN